MANANQTNSELLMLRGFNPSLVVRTECARTQFWKSQADHQRAVQPAQSLTISAMAWEVCKTNPSEIVNRVMREACGNFLDGRKFSLDQVAPE